MIKISNSKLLIVFTKLLTLLAVAKAISLGIWWYLPDDGIELNLKKGYSPKYRRVNFNNMISRETNSFADNKISSGINITNMILKGLYAKGSSGYAIVALKSNPKMTSIIAIGEIYQGYILKSIKLTSIIFEKNGKDFILELENREVDSLPQNINSEQSSSEITVSRRDITYFAKRPQEIWKNISIVEVKNAGKITGFKITNINPKSKFAILGLKKNDLIIKLNNVALDSYNSVIEAYKNINNIDTIQIVVIRENQEKELVYEIH